MAGTKYDKYIKVAPYSDERIGSVTHIAGGKDLCGTNFTIGWVGIPQPLFMIKEGHTHEYEEYLFFFGGNPANTKEFGAEVELCLGEEAEKHIIDKPSVVYIPKGFKHCPLNFYKVDKPVLFMDVSLSPDYQKK